jgi:hypothetical protein
VEYRSWKCCLVRNGSCMMRRIFGTGYVMDVHSFSLQARHRSELAPVLIVPSKQ